MGADSSLVIVVDLGNRLLDQILQLSEIEGVDVDDALRLVVVAGLRFYKTKHRIRCGFENCTREDCCGRRAQIHSINQKVGDGA